MHVFSDLRRGIVLGCLSVFLLCGETRADDNASPPLATVNKHTIQQRDVDLELLISGIKNPTSVDRDAALERVIDRILVSVVIDPKGADPLASDVEDLVQFVRRGIESGGDHVDNVLGKLKLTEADVRQAARMSVNWNAYVYRTVTDREIRAYFEQHREQFDGTRIRLRQIVRTVPADAPTGAWDEAEKLLSELRQQIEAGQLDFADAARMHSQSPSGKDGGEIGLVRYQGDVPIPVAVAAFALKTGQTSSPIRSTVGVHLLQVTERQPGDLSLEDARPAILRVLGDQLWDKTVQKERAKAKIKR